MSYRRLIFEGDTWDEYERLRSTDRVAHRNLVKLLKQMIREDPARGPGKPERLRHGLTGLWSRRITHRDRLIYCFDDESIHVLAIGGHYERP